MARLVTKFKYLKPDQEKPIGGYATYIATREGVEKIDESFKLAPATVKHQKLIEKILRDFPDSAAMLEYEDYQREKTVGAASEFITRAIEDNAHEILNQKTYGLGKLYLSRDFSGRDVKKAIDYLMAAAGKGHDYAMYTLGKLFLEGKEIPKNPEYALRWLEEAVEKENPYAEYLLGKTLLQGVDLPQFPRTFPVRFPFWKKQRHAATLMRRMPWEKHCWKEPFFCRIFQEPWSCLLSLRIKDSPQRSICWGRSSPMESCSRRTSPKPSSI